MVGRKKIDWSTEPPVYPYGDLGITRVATRVAPITFKERHEMQNGTHIDQPNGKPSPLSRMIPKPKQPDITAYFHDVFSREEIGLLEQIALVVKEPGTAGGGSSIRRCTAGMLNPYELHWFSERLCCLLTQANSHHFRFHLEGLSEMLQLVRYEVKDGYDWHLDMRPDFSRKISISVQLSDEKDYDGGELDIMVSADQIETMPKTRGTVILYPSYVMHRVRPVTRGTRCALVTWVSGDPFK